MRRRFVAVFPPEFTLFLIVDRIPRFILRTDLFVASINLFLPRKIPLAIPMAFRVPVRAVLDARACLVNALIKCHVSSPILRGYTGTATGHDNHQAEGWTSAV